MNCANIFCIYNLKNKCILKKITINLYGICDDCIYPNIDEKILEEAKTELLKEYED